MIFENQDGLFAMIVVAIVIAVGEPCPDFSQIARPDWRTAQHTERLRAGRPAIHQDESHGVVPRMLRTVVHFSSPVGFGWVVVGEPPLLAALVVVQDL
jgi:hypothetical protein